MLSPLVTQARTVLVTTAPDQARDARVERFWDRVCKLIFDERRALEWKQAALGRYSRALASGGDGFLADLARRLSESYGDSLTGTAIWS